MSYASYLRQPQTLEEAQDILLERYGSEYDIYEAECGRLHEEPLNFAEYCEDQGANL